jgi:glutamyl-tRNA reductase
VASLAGVALYGIDDLPAAGVVGGIPAEALARADRAIDHAVGRAEQWLAARAAVPVIEALRWRADAIIRGEIRRANGRLRALDGAERDAVRLVAEAVIRKLLHHPTVRLREMAARHDALGLEIARGLFDIDGDATRGSSSL